MRYTYAGLHQTPAGTTEQPPNNQEFKFPLLKEYNASPCLQGYGFRLFRAQIRPFQPCQLKKASNPSTSQVLVDEWGGVVADLLLLSSTILLMKPRFRRARMLNITNLEGCARNMIF